jgi:hypothetical protein
MEVEPLAHQQVVKDVAQIEKDEEENGGGNGDEFPVHGIP